MRKKYHTCLSVCLMLNCCLCFGTAIGGEFYFGEPQLIESLDSPWSDTVSWVSADGLTAYLELGKGGGMGLTDIWVSQRESVSDEWNEPANLGSPVNTGGFQSTPWVSPNGLELYFCGTGHPGGHGSWDIWVAKRSSVDEPWGVPENPSTLNSSAYDAYPMLSHDGLLIYFSSERGSDVQRMYVAWRETINDAWSSPELLAGDVHSSGHHAGPVISRNGKLLLFSDDWVQPMRPGGLGGGDIWMAFSETGFDEFGPAINVGATINSSSRDIGPKLSLDERTLYFSSKRQGGLGGPITGDPYKAPMIPIVDFNADGMVDIDDLRKLMDHRGQDHPKYDVDPPLGDGIVDGNDIEALVNLWGPVQEPSLLAYYRLDETEGNLVQDSAGEADGFVIGQAQWRPELGVSGAVFLDGNAFVGTPSILNPADGPFSVFARVQLGVAGQVIIAQKSGSNWLLIDELGNLKTEFKRSGRNSEPLSSEALTADFESHRIGLVWDGTC